MNITHYVKAESLEEAYMLNQKNTAAILGGGCWLRLGQQRVGRTIIDLEKLGLDKIEETKNEFIVGCMVSLRRLELSKELDVFTNGALRESLHHIVGTQFRNMATIGGSLFGRFGFSDVLTCFLVLDTEVELYKAGRVSLAQFVSIKPDKDILVRLIVKKTPRVVAYESLRLTATDFPVLACAVSKDTDDGVVRCAIGARPAKAKLFREGQELFADGFSAEAIKMYAACVQDSFVFGSNIRASAAYRKDMAKVLVTRALTKIMVTGGTENDNTILD
ncbi:MAG: FAD binding domain-containing protein [Selenomonadaceae bacterium]